MYKILYSILKEIDLVLVCRNFTAITFMSLIQPVSMRFRKHFWRIRLCCASKIVAKYWKVFVFLFLDFRVIANKIRHGLETVTWFYCFEAVCWKRKLWKTLKPFLSDKTPSSVKITLVDQDEIISTGNETADVLNTNFSKIISNLKIPECPASNPIYNKISDPVLKAIMKYKNHPNIKAIERVPKVNDLFKFTNVDKTEIFNEIVCLDASKVCQDTDVPTEIIKENADICVTYFS